MEIPTTDKNCLHKHPYQTISTSGASRSSLTSNFKLDKMVESGDVQKPVVILMGWIGSIDKHLKPYATIYEENGITTLRYTTPNNVPWKYKVTKKAAKEIIEKLTSDENLKNKPVIIHLFSNGGSFLYNQLVHISRINNIPVQVKGVILDSAPARNSVLVAFGSFTSSVFARSGPEKYLAYPFALGFAFYVIHILHPSLKFLDRLKGLEHVPFDPYNSLINEKSLWPQHFIYSTKDALVDYRGVQKFMEQRKSLGVEVTSQLYDNSTHVRHYPINKLSYTKSVLNFVSKCLRK